LTVENTHSDTSVGSLQSVIAFAAAHPGADTITLDPNLDVPGGQTITLTGPADGYAINIGDSAGVTIDASNLSAGLTIQGAGPGGSFGLFNVNSGASLTLRGLTLANGGGSNFGHDGGAIYNEGTLALTQCTLSGNTTTGFGGAISNSFGTATLTQCTLSGNSAAQLGGAIENNTGGQLGLMQCTVSDNHVTGTNGSNGGGGIDNFGTSVTMTNTIVAGNTAGSGKGPDLWAEMGLLTASNCLIGNAANSSITNGTNGNITGVNALLATLANYGGPTKTMPPLPGSPAIDRGLNSAIPNDPATTVPFTTDQRGFTRISNGTVDIGAVETSAIQVTTNLNNNAGSLRQAVNQASDITTTITFAPGVAGPIQLASEIVLGKNLAIDASASASGMTISGGGTNRIFTTNSGETIVLTGLTLTGGNGAGTTASGSGGAIYNNGAALTLNQCSLLGNTTSGGSGAGGAIRNATPGTASLVLNRSTVANNTTNANGTVGGIACSTIPTFITQCTFAGNSTTGVGGALSVASGGSLAVTQSTIAGNTAGTGGGINNAGTTTLTNSIVATNTATTGPDISNGGTVTLAGANIIQALSGTAPTGPAAMNANPLLAPVGSYGGRTQTMALLMNSPARDKAVGSTFTSDQRGPTFAITDGKPDIGAYEAGDISNYFAWIYENLPASTASDANAHAMTFDFDGDGVTNVNEWMALTNPGDPTSYLHVTQFAHSGNSVSITFSSVSGRHYSVEESSDLNGWSFLEGAIPAAVGTVTTRTYFFAGGVPSKLFFHVLPGP
jgi:fibronectin-binding autotransporter adhesin